MSEPREGLIGDAVAVEAGLSTEDGALVATGTGTWRVISTRDGPRGDGPGRDGG